MDEVKMVLESIAQYPALLANMTFLASGYSVYSSQLV